MAEGKLGRLRDRFARDGMGRTLGKAFGDHIYRRSDSVVMALNRGEARLGAVRPHEAMTFAALSAGDKVPPLSPFLAPRRRYFASMLSAGKIGVFVLRNGTAVGCAWIAFSDHHDKGILGVYPVASGEAYLYNWLLEPAERPRGTALIFVRWMLRFLDEMGVHRIFSVIERDNRVSYLIHQHFGYRESGMLVRYFNLFHLRWMRMSRYAGTLGLADARRGRRTT